MKANLNNRSRISDIPGQQLSLQYAVSDDEPTQSLPPADGAGLVHVLVLDFDPVPQVFVHIEYSPHALH